MRSQEGEPLLNESDRYPPRESYTYVGLDGIAWNFGAMGLSAFGGPAAHIAMFSTTFVDRYQWISAVAFAEIYALCACLPGPTSTQVSFAIGAVKRGVPAGLAGGLAFQHPGLIAMSAIGVLSANILHGDPTKTKWYITAAVDGLAAVGVALVAVAAKGLVTKHCKDGLTSIILLLSACISYVYTAPWLFPALIAGGGLLAILFPGQRSARLGSAADEEQGRANGGHDGIDGFGLSHTSGAVLLTVWAIILAAGFYVVAAVGYEDVHWLQPAHWFAAFYRVGSLIYGGGQVVLPLLIQVVVQKDCHVDENNQEVCTERPDTWVTEDQFKAGLAIIQAMPGPLFNLSAYLGAVIAVRAGWNFAVGVAACWLGLFGPGIMLLYGLLPFWGKFRQSKVYGHALPGLSAAAVGLVVTAVFQMYNNFVGSSMFPKMTVAIGMVGFCLVDAVEIPPAFAVTVGGVFGYHPADPIKIPAPFAVLVGGVLGVIAGFLNLP